MTVSDNEDERPLQATDRDVLRDEQAIEDLLQPRPPGFRRMFNAPTHDPNQPRFLETQPSHTQSSHRRAERHARRRRRRRGHNDDEAGLLDEGEGRSSSGSDGGSDLPLEEFSEKTEPHKRRLRLRFAMIFLGLVVLLLALLYGTYQTSVHDAARVKHPRLLSNGTSLFAPTTILISLDGFRADFLDRGITPTLDSLVKQGISPKFMLPSFPSLTFPNHWTLVTGQYPESHGIVGNSFWDPSLGEEFWYTDPNRSMDPKWWSPTGVQPLWSIAEAQGVRAAVHMWPGSEAGVEPMPTYLDKFNGKEPLDKKISTVLQHIDRPGEFDGEFVAHDEARPHFISFYVPTVDTYGHRYGPNSTEMRQAITDVDSMLNTLFESLERRNLTEIVNIIVVSDHGMATTSVDRLYQLDDYLNVDDIAHIDGWPLYGLRPKPNVDLPALYESLQSKTRDDPHLSVYLREDIPARFHFSRSDRIAPLWLIPEAGWAILQRKDFDIQAAKASGEDYTLHGLHGYDNEHPLMRAIFIARGPAFPHVPHSEMAVFQNIEVYNIVCDSLDMTGHPNNGTQHLPLKPIGIHQGSANDSQGPNSGHEAEQASGHEDGLASEHESKPENETDESDDVGAAVVSGFFNNALQHLKETWHKITSVFDGAGSS